MTSQRATSTKNNPVDKWFETDKNFDKLIPLAYREISQRHWTPVDVAKKAAEFLASGSKHPQLLDIGAGLGKFCATAAHFTKAPITGIEQRESLVTIGNEIIQSLGLQHVQLIQENITKCDFQKYNGIYFYNAFYENIDQTSSPIDTTIEFSSGLYRYYSDILYKKLKEQPTYTRLATYHTNNSSIPEEYSVLETHFAGLLKLWIKYE